MVLGSALLVPCLAIVVGHGPVMPSGLGIKPSMKLRPQAQATILAQLSNAQRFGGIEAQVNLSIYSLGIALGAGYEQVNVRSPGQSAVLHGGYVHVGLQWRFVALLHKKVFRWFDPHIDLGGLFGGVRGERDGTAWLQRGALFRGVFYVGASADVRLAPWKVHPVLTVQYRFHAAQRPTEAARHSLLLGIGIRRAD